MRIFVTSNFERKYKKLVRKKTSLGKKIDNKILLLRENPHYSSLRLHKLISRRVEEWSISIETDLRVVFQYVDKGILLTDIGSHNEVY